MRPDDPAGIGGGARGGGGSPGLLSSPLGLIVAANIIVFVIQYFGGVGQRVITENGIAFLPGGSVSREGLFKRGEVWTLFTYMFVHGGVLHILLNMLMIVVCGRMVVRLVGNRHFLWIYFTSGVAGALLQMVFSPVPLVGASACAFGLLVALGAIIPQQEMRMLLYFVLPIRLRMKTLALGLVIVSALFFLIDLAAGPGASIPMVSGIGHAAHLGGALAGYVYVRLRGLGGRVLTRQDLERQRAKNERKVERSRRKSRRAKSKIVSIVDGRPISDEETKPKDPMRTKMDEVLDKMNKEGRATPTAEERQILEASARSLGKGADE